MANIKFQAKFLQPPMNVLENNETWKIIIIPTLANIFLDMIAITIFFPMTFWISNFY